MPGPFSSLRARPTLLLVALAAAALLAAPQLASADPVSVTGGRVEGVQEDGLTIYRGIPFAAPPVGELRWKPPQPVAPWNGVRSAADFGAGCMQAPGALSGGQPLSEDCLTLNVWTPATSADAKLPVMVWIYGGGFSMGSTRTPTYSGHEFAKDGVVFVSVNYRVGRFGFFAHPAITAEDPTAPIANYAIMDQIAGLEWVRDNIAAFGGDPDNVTILGESAGGISINALMAAPVARGLFDRAISQSGFGRTVGQSLADAEAQGLAFAGAYGIEGRGPAAAAALRALRSEQVMTTPGGGGRGGGAPPGGGGAIGGLPYPTIDGRMFTEQISETFKAGRQAPVPYMAGGNSYEASLFSFVRNAPDSVYNASGDADRARQIYVAGDRDAGLGALDLTTDLQVTEPARLLTREMAEIGQPAFAYYFSYVPEAQRGQVPGAAHGNEIAYAFGTLSSDNADSRAISEAMHAYWLAFARTGDPGSAGGPDWAPVTNDGYAFMEFGDDGPVLHDRFMEEKLDFVESFMEDR